MSSQISNVPIVSPHIGAANFPRQNNPLISRSNDFDLRNFGLPRTAGVGGLEIFESKISTNQDDNDNTQRIIRPITTIKSVKCSLLLAPLHIEVIDEASKGNSVINQEEQKGEESIPRIPFNFNKDSSIKSFKTDAITTSELSS